MNKPSIPRTEAYALDGIEVVELWEVDLDFAVEEAFREGASRTLQATRSEPATPEQLRTLELFHGLDAKDLAALAPQCRSIHAIPGYVLLAHGRLNTNIFFVLEGQLRLYARTGDKRPIAVADVGQSTGLRSALSAQPAHHAVIATEMSHILAVDLTTLDEFTKHSHTFARDYAALLTTYLRGDNCLNVGTRERGATTRQGHVDELTLLHNQHWIDTVLPRLIGRFRMGDRKLSVTAFAIDKLEDTIRQNGVGAGMRVLEAMGHWMLDQTRPTDLLAINQNRRFLAFLPDCDLNAALQLASRLKSQAQSVSVSLAPDKPNTEIKVTLALGIAELETGMNEIALLDKVEALIQKSIKLGGDWLSDSLESPS